MQLINLAWVGWTSKLGDGKWVSLEDSSIFLNKQAIKPTWYQTYPTNGVPDTCIATYQNQWFNMDCNLGLYCGICQVQTGPNFILRGKYQFKKANCFYSSTVHDLKNYFYVKLKAYVHLHHLTHTMDGQVT